MLLLLQMRAVCFILPFLVVCGHAFVIGEQQQRRRLYKVNDIYTDNEETIFDKIVKNNKASLEELFEGDIKLPDEAVTEREEETRKRSVVRNQILLWTDRIVPYELTSEVESGEEMILKAFREIERVSCVSFKKRTTEKSWIKLVSRNGCYSNVGRMVGDQSQTVSLTNGCMNSLGTILHELLHALGFYHEQSRPDRDAYIEIMWENIEAREQYNFAKKSQSTADYMNTDYDLASIMHYGSKSFSKNGKVTIKAIGNENVKLGQRDNLSVKDVIRLNALYKCKDVGKVYTTWSDWGPCNDNCQKKRQRFCSGHDKSRCPEIDLFGVHTEYGQCTEAECNKPVNGHWGRWSAWGECNAECGGGEETRKRVCDDPQPKNGGTGCHGDDQQTRECYIKPCGLRANDCQFDGQGMCFWQDTSPKNSYIWRRTSGKTTTTNTGPDGDHSTQNTTKDGHYMYAEASSPAVTDEKARLTSSTFPSVHSRCMTFFYNMNGAGIGALRVFLVNAETGSKSKIWEKIWKQGEGWKEGVLDISTDQPYMIEFESERGPSFQGDIALDDVYFRNSKCSEPMEEGEGGNPSPPPSVPTTTTSTTTTTATTSTTTTTTTLPDPISQICGVPLKPMGCFVEKPSNRAMEEMLDSHRSGSGLFHGVGIVWDKYPDTLKKLLCDCVNRAKKKGLNYIGLQFFGECWGSKTPTFFRHGTSSTCRDSLYQKCGHRNKQNICIGEAETNYVYELL